MLDRLMISLQCRKYMIYCRYIHPMESTRHILHNSRVVHPKPQWLNPIAIFKIRNRRSDPAWLRSCVTCKVTTWSSNYRSQNRPKARKKVHYQGTRWYHGRISAQVHSTYGYTAYRIYFVPFYHPTEKIFILSLRRVVKIALRLVPCCRIHMVESQIQRPGIPREKHGSTRNRKKWCKKTVKTGNRQRHAETDQESPQGEKKPSPLRKR